MKVLGVLTQRTLSSMVKGIRSTSEGERSAFITKCLGEIKSELQSGDVQLQSNALRKLIFLQMIGYDMGWAAFYTVQVMGNAWFGYRRVGYLSASLSFTQDTDVIILTTHLFRKAFTQLSTQASHSLADGLQYEIGSALGCLAAIVTPALAEAMIKDI
jgi:AP-3 complex subunit delta-1